MLQTIFIERVHNMHSTVKRLRSIAITLAAVAATNLAISYASGLPMIPDAPRPKSGLPMIPDAPRPKSGLPMIPDAPRPKSGLPMIPDAPRP